MAIVEILFPWPFFFRAMEKKTSWNEIADSSTAKGNENG